MTRLTGSVMEFLSFGSDRPQRQAVRQERSNLIHTSLAASLCLAESVARIAASSIATPSRKLHPSILKTGSFGLID
jgi:hypothetical protein